MLLVMYQLDKHHQRLSMFPYLCYTDVAKCSCAFNATDGKLLKKAICRLFIKTSYAEMINNNIMNELSVMDSNQSCSLLKFF